MASNSIIKRKMITIGGKIRKSMNKRGWWSDKIGKNVLARCAVVCIAAAFIGSFGIPCLALGTEVTVNAPEYVEGTFNATIDVDSIRNFNSAQFDLSFDSDVVNS